MKTKDRTVFPQADYDNSNPLYCHEHQRILLFFISLVKHSAADVDDPHRFTHACLLTGLEEHGQVLEKDQIELNNGTKFWTTCLNVAMTD